MLKTKNIFWTTIMVVMTVFVSACKKEDEKKTSNDLEIGDETGVIVPVKRISYDYKKNEFIQDYTDTIIYQGRAISKILRDGELLEKNSINEKGLITKTAKYKNGVNTRTSYFQYNDKDLLVRRIHASIDRNSGKEKRDTLDYEFDDTKRIISIKIKRKNYKSLESFTYGNQSIKSIKVGVVLDKQDTIKSETIYKLDTKGNVIEDKNITDSEVRTISYDFDDKNKVFKNVVNLPWIFKDVNNKTKWIINYESSENTHEYKFEYTKDGYPSSEIKSYSYGGGKPRVRTKVEYFYGRVK